MGEPQAEIGEQGKQFVFGDREEDEKPQAYYQRVILANFQRGVPVEEIARVMGRVTGDKEEREGIDGLTRMAGRAIFERDLEREFENLRRLREMGTQRRVALILVDIDDFKKYNDEHGYTAGDEKLLGVASVLTPLGFISKRVIRCYRWGGEEFAVIVRDTATDEAEEIARQIREQVTERIGVTISVGIAHLRDDNDTALEMFNRANVAISIAKGKTTHPSVTGTPKNRTVTWEKSMPSTLRNG